MTEIRHLPTPPTADPRRHAAKPRRDLAHAHRLLAQRVRGLPSWVLLVQLFIGFGWLRAATEKLIDVEWFTGDVLQRFITEHDTTVLGWYRPFIESVVAPYAPVMALTVLAGQLIAALSLLTGRRTGWGLGIGIFLNLHFLAAGAVTPSAFYLLAQGSVVLWMAENATTYRAVGYLRLAAMTAAFFAALSVPFISTLDPAHVIEDPGMMFAFGGALAAVACLVAVDSPSTRGPRRPATPDGVR